MLALAVAFAAVPAPGQQQAEQRPREPSRAAVPSTPDAMERCRETGPMMDRMLSMMNDARQAENSSRIDEMLGRMREPMIRMRQSMDECMKAMSDMPGMRDEDSRVIAFHPCLRLVAPRCAVSSFSRRFL
jgi:hypothetical protein